MTSSYLRKVFFLISFVSVISVPVVTPMEVDDIDYDVFEEPTPLYIVSEDSSTVENEQSEQSKVVEDQNSEKTEASAQDEQETKPQDQAVNENMDDALQNMLAMFAGADKQGEGQTTDVGKGLAALGSPDAQKAIAEFVRAAMQEYAEKEQLRRKKLLDILPEQLGAQITHIESDYHDLVQRVSVGNALVSLCVDARRAIENELKAVHDAVTDDAGATTLLHNVEDASNQLAKLHESLVAGTFNDFVQQLLPEQEISDMKFVPAMDINSMMGDLTNMFGKTARSFPYTKQDLSSLVQSLKNLQNNAALKSGAVADLLQVVELLEEQKTVEFIGTVLHVVERDSVAMLQELDLCATKLNEFFEEKYNTSIRSYLIAKRDAVEQEQEEENKEEVDDYRDALIHWYRECKKYSQTLRVFIDLKREASLENGTKTRIISFTRSLAHVCDMGIDFFNLYKIDHHNYSWDSKRIIIPYIMNYSMRAALSYWYYSEMTSGTARSNVLKMALGETSLTSQSQVQFLVSRWSALAMAVPVFFSPSFWFRRQHDLVQGVSKVLVAWSYYHLCQYQLFGDPEGHRLWPNNNEHIIRSMIFCGHKIGRTASDQIAWKMRRNVDPYYLEKAEDYTWGVVRPEMVSAIFDSFIPYVMLNMMPKSVVDCNRSHVYPFSFVRGLAQRTGLNGQQLIGLGRLDNLNAIRDNQNLTAEQRQQVLDRYNRRSNTSFLYDGVFTQQPDDGYGPDMFYIEQMLTGYVASSVGMYWGRYLTKCYKSSISRLISKGTDLAVDCAEMLGFIEKNAAEELLVTKDQMFEDSDQFLDILKQFAAQVFQPRSPLRMMFLNVCAEHGFIDKEETDSDKINRNLIIVILTELARYRLFTNAEAARVIQTFDHNPLNTDEVASKIVEGLRDNIIALGGGMVGSAVMRSLADMVSWQYGPFVPKIKQAFS